MAQYPRPGLNHGASSGDRCELAEQAVADVGHVPMAGENSLAKESSESGDALGESHGDGGLAHGSPLAVVATGAIRVEDLGEGARIEPVPAEPEEESVEDNEGCAVAAKRDGAAEMVELANSGAFDEGAP